MSVYSEGGDPCGRKLESDSGLELLVRDNPRDTHPALPSRAFTASKHRNGSNVNINSQTPGSIICYVLSTMNGDIFCDHH